MKSRFGYRVRKTSGPARVRGFRRCWSTSRVNAIDEDRGKVTRLGRESNENEMNDDGDDGKTRDDGETDTREQLETCLFSIYRSPYLYYFVVHCLCCERDKCDRCDHCGNIRWERVRQWSLSAHGPRLCVTVVEGCQMNGSVQGRLEDPRDAS